VRHELVPRNGKKKDGSEHDISEADIKGVIKLAEELVSHIEKAWLDVSSAAWGREVSLAENEPL